MAWLAIAAVFASVLLALLYILRLNPIEILLICVGVTFHLLWLFPIVFWRINLVPIKILRKEWEISWSVGLGGGYYGICIGALVGLDSTGPEPYDIFGFILLYGFGLGLGVTILISFYALVLLEFIWVICKPFKLVVQEKLSGVVAGLWVGGSAWCLVTLSLPTNRQEVMLRIIFPAILCAISGGLLGQAHRAAPGEMHC